MPSNPPIGIAPPNNVSSAANETAAVRLSTSSTVPANLIAPASTSSERTHFQASAEQQDGKRNAPMPKPCSSRSANQAPG